MHGVLHALDASDVDSPSLINSYIPGQVQESARLLVAGSMRTDGSSAHDIRLVRQRVRSTTSLCLRVAAGLLLLTGAVVAAVCTLVAQPGASAAARPQAFFMAEMDWCNCILNSNQVSMCSALAPSWLASYTGRRGKLYLTFSEGGLGNAMLHLRDNFALALLLDRRPVIIDPQGANGLDRMLELLPAPHGALGAKFITELPPTDKRSLRRIHTLDDLRTALLTPPKASQPLYSHFGFWYLKKSVFRGFASLAKDLAVRQPSTARLVKSLLLLDPPPCWSSAFVRPVSRLRKVARTNLNGTCGAAHIRMCSALNWTDTCKQAPQPERNAVELLHCACSNRRKQSKRVFVATDSVAVLESATRALSFEHGQLDSSSTSSVSAKREQSGAIDVVSSSMGVPVHRYRTAERIRSQGKNLERILVDWATFAYSPRTVLLPSTFAASAACMFAPHAEIRLYRPDPNDGLLECDRPFVASVAPGVHKGHPCAAAMGEYIAWKPWQR